MKIDKSKVNLTEKDIEDWLYQYPGALSEVLAGEVHTIARQYKVPSGIIDILGVMKSHYTGRTFLFVAELKNVPIDSGALAQVSRYAADIEQIIMCRGDFASLDIEAQVLKVCVGTDVSNQTLFEAYALNVATVSFSVEFRVDLNGRYRWNTEFNKELVKKYNDASGDEVFGLVAEYAKQFQKESKEEQIENDELEIGLLPELEEAIQSAITRQEN